MSIRNNLLAGFKSNEELKTKQYCSSWTGDEHLYYQNLGSRRKKIRNSRSMLVCMKNDPHILCIWTPGLQLVALFGKIMESLENEAMLEEVHYWWGLWEFIALPYFLFPFSASWLWMKCDQSASYSCLWLLLCLPCHSGIYASGILIQTNLFFFKLKKLTMTIQKSD